LTLGVDRPGCHPGCPPAATSPSRVRCRLRARWRSARRLHRAFTTTRQWPTFGRIVPSETRRVTLTRRSDSTRDLGVIWRFPSGHSYSRRTRSGRHVTEEGARIFRNRCGNTDSFPAVSAGSMDMLPADFAVLARCPYPAPFRAAGCPQVRNMQNCRTNPFWARTAWPQIRPQPLSRNGSAGVQWLRIRRSLRHRARARAGRWLCRTRPRACRHCQRPAHRGGP
jgi:hypothetical protein